MLFGREPVAIAGFIAIAINLSITLGLKLSVEQVALVNSLVVAGLALLVRSAVTPTGAPVLSSGTEVKVQGTDGTTTI